MNAATIISLIAAFGVGTITAAGITRWNSVSQLRQAWVDALRKEIAEFFNAVERVGAAANPASTAHKELRDRRDHVMFVYRQILLRLNLKEVGHRRLDRRLRALLKNAGTVDLEAVDAALTASRRVLKAEWDRTKYGPFLHAARRYKKCMRWWRAPRGVRSRRGNSTKTKPATVAEATATHSMPTK